MASLSFPASESVGVPRSSHRRSAASSFNKPGLAEGVMLDHHNPATNLRKKASIKSWTEKSQRQNPLDTVEASMKEDNESSSHRHSVSTDQLPAEPPHVYP